MMMSKNEHPNIADRDWRLQAIAVLSRDAAFNSGAVIPQGSSFEASGFAKLTRKGRPFGFPLPNAVSLYLSIAHGCGKMGFDYIQNNLVDSKRQQQGATFEAFDGDESALFDAMENMLVCIVLSFSAVELFANLTIPDDYEYSVKRRDGTGIDVFDKAQIERCVSTEDKLDKILPDVCKVDSPKGSGPWGQFKWLQKTRNRLIHLKPIDWRDKQSPETSNDVIWTALLSKRAADSPRHAFNIIDYYYPTSREERWMSRFRLILNES